MNQISNQSVQRLYDSLKHEQHELLKEIEALNNRQLQITSELMLLATNYQIDTGEAINPSPVTNKNNIDQRPVTVKPQYDRNWSWTEKITFACTYAGKPISPNEAVDILVEFEPSLGGKNIIETKKRVNTSLTQNKDKGLKLASDEGRGLKKYTIRK